MIARVARWLLLVLAASPAAAQLSSDSAPSALYAAPGEALDLRQFAFARAIPSGAGLTTVRLDAAALAHSRIDDVRIVDERGRQVPYVLERLGDLIAVPLPTPAPTAGHDSELRTNSGRPAGTAYHVALPYPGLPDAVLRLATSARVFEREIVVVAPRSSPRDAPPAERAMGTVARERWEHASPDSVAPSVELLLGRRLPTDSLIVLVDDGDNKRLPLSSATLLLPTYRLRFFRQAGAPLTLRYGRRDLSAPRYDLALLATSLTGAAAEEVTLGPELASDSATPETGRYLFWTVLGLAMVALLALIVRLLRRPAAA